MSFACVGNEYCDNYKLYSIVKNFNSCNLRSNIHSITCLFMLLLIHVFISLSGIFTSPTPKLIYKLTLIISLSGSPVTWTFVLHSLPINDQNCIQTQKWMPCIVFILKQSWVQLVKNTENEPPLRTVWCKTITITWSTNQNENDRNIGCLRQSVHEGILHQGKVSEKAARQKKTMFYLHPETRRGVRPWTRGKDVAVIQSYPLIPGMT